MSLYVIGGVVINKFASLLTFFSLNICAASSQNSAEYEQELARVQKIVERLLYPLADYYAERVENFITYDMIIPAIAFFLVTFWLVRMMLLEPDE